MIKALFFDLDGTLLNSRKNISEPTLAALYSLKQNGTKIFAATGRQATMPQMFYWWTERELNVFDGGVYCNGSWIKIGEQEIFRRLPVEIVTYCVQQTAKYEGLTVALQQESGALAFNHPLDDRGYLEWGTTREESLPINEQSMSRAIKILIYRYSLDLESEPLPKTLTENIRRFCEDKAKYYLTDHDSVIQITEKESTKRNGVEQVRQMLGLDKTEIAVFGDDLNDVEMLTEYPYSVAMNNAMEDVKKAAAYVTKSNDEDGVIYAIEHWLPMK